MLDYILKNKTYAGTLIQGKRERISHKNHNIVRKPEEEWIVSENTHNSIISETIFNQVQSILYNRNVRVNKKGRFHKYTGFVKCSECGNNLYRMARIKKGEEQIYYYCSTYIKSKKCNKHYILEKELDDIVIKSINKYIDLVCEIEKKLIMKFHIQKLNIIMKLKKSN